MSKKVISLVAASVAATLFVPTFANADENTLHVYNWSNYIGEQTIANFEKQTGIKVVYDVFDSNEVLEAKLLAGHSGYDIVVPSNQFLAKQIRAGVFQKLNKDELPNWKNLEPKLLNTLSVSDTDNQYSMPYLWGSIGIGLNIDKVKAVLGEDAPIDSWDLVFKPENIEKLKSCGVSFLDSPTEVLPIALNYLKLDTATQNAADIQKAQDLFLSIRPNIRYFHSSKYISDLANGDTCVAIGYSNDVFIAQARAEEANNGVHIQYVIPKEGAGSYFDMMAIPQDAANPKAAHAFLNYLMQPEVIAEITNEVTAANGNQAANDLVDPQIAQNKGIYPDAETMGKIYAIADLPMKVQRVMTRAWTKIKTDK